MQFNIDNYKGKYAMYCKTKEEAKEFCKYLNSVGKTWRDGSPYVSNATCPCPAFYWFNEGTWSYTCGENYAGYTILKWSDVNRLSFIKADLKTGDVILLRNGTVGIINRELDISITRSGYGDLDNLRYDLTSIYNKECDVIAIRRPVKKEDCTFYAFKLHSGTLVYARKEVEEMTLAEVCKLLGKEIKIIP